ncbi:MAG: formylglycine-generating enzyme family protein [Desulfobacterales bacterium]|nr:formylglycine-generating enzyme family protein [Desulfobacterales bacterium]
MNTTTPVGCFSGGKSPYEVLDMAGNVWEWCRDWYAKDYYYKSPEKDPIGPDDGGNRVVRGGAWYYDAGYCRSAYRDGDVPDFRDGIYGFRLVRLPGQPGEPSK